MTCASLLLILSSSSPAHSPSVLSSSSPPPPLLSSTSPVCFLNPVRSPCSRFTHHHPTCSPRLLLPRPLPSSHSPCPSAGGEAPRRRWLVSLNRQAYKLSLLMAVRVVGVMGCTGTGKSCVSAELASLLEADVVEGDKCFLPPHECPWLDLTHIWPKEQIPEALASKKADTNHPDALDWVKFDEMIASAREVAEVQRRKAVIIDSFLLQCREVVRRHITDVVFLDDSNMHPGELARRKWERGHLGKKSYKERGVSFEDYRL